MSAPITMQVVPAHTASRLIRPDKIKRVCFRFVTRGGAASVQTPKVRATYALRQLAEKGADVALEIDAEHGDATIMAVAERAP